jgi:hypothetical protein
MRYLKAAADYISLGYSLSRRKIFLLFFRQPFGLQHFVFHLRRVHLQIHADASNPFEFRNQHESRSTHFSLATLNTSIPATVQLEIV